MLRRAQIERALCPTTYETLSRTASLVMKNLSLLSSVLGMGCNNKHWDMKVSFSRNRVPVGDTATETENVAEEVSKALECFGEARISFIIWPVFAASRVAGLMPLAYKPTPATQLTPSTGSANSAPSTKRQAIRGPDLNVSYPWLSVCILALCVSSYAFSVELGHLHQVRKMTAQTSDIFISVDIDNFLCQIPGWS